MARDLRQVSESGFYHVTMRGNGRQLLFEDDRDRRFFLGTLSGRLREDGLKLYAWCLMDNHVHLLLGDEKGRLSHAMQAIGSTYARYFNTKTGHVGAVFQGRFGSKPIESDEYLMLAARYIHNNPRKAGVTDSLDYPWSSYRDYMGHPHLADTGLLLDLMGGRSGFAAFMEDEKLDAYRPPSGRRPSAEEVLARAEAALGAERLASLSERPVAQRNEGLRVLRGAGLSIRQIERVTGIGRNAIANATR